MTILPAQRSGISYTVVVIVVLAITALVAVLLNGIPSSRAQRRAAIIHFDELRSAEDRLAEIVFRLRHGDMVNYDPLNHAYDSVRAHHRGDRHDRLPGLHMESLAGAERIYWNNVVEREAQLERFKYLNAVLRTSLNYFRSETREQLHHIGTATTGADREALISVSDAIWRYVHADDATATKDDMEAILSRLSAWAKSQSDGSGKAYSRLLAHGELIMRTKPELDEVTARLAGAATRYFFDQYYLAYRSFLDSEAEYAERTRLALAVLTVFLLTGFALLAARQLRIGRRLEQQTTFVKWLTDHLGAGVLATDATGNIGFANPAAAHLLGFEDDQLAGRPLPELLSGRGDENALLDTPRSAAVQGIEYTGEAWLHTHDGTPLPVELTLAPLHYNDGGRVTVAVFIDIRGRIETQRQLMTLAYYDGLTGLPNRTLFFDRLNGAINRAVRHASSLAVMIVDLDNFKQVNDSYGHVSGDQLLTIVAQRLRERMRGSDTVCRLGGDEFAILLEDASNPVDISNIAQEVVDALSNTFALAEGEVHTGCSIGITLFPQDGTGCEDLLKNADVALYRAKDAGRGNYQFFTADMARAVVDNHDMERGLRLALETNEGIAVYFQPKISLESGLVTGFEALARWRAGDGSMVSPTRFIPVTEKSGLIGEFAERILDEACRSCVAWQGRFPGVGVAFNLSAVQFSDVRLPKSVERILANTGLAPELLELEITESLLLKHSDQVNQTLHALRHLGCTLAIDDFGTGYSSLIFLKRFAVNVLKIDKSFVEGLGAKALDGTDRALVAAMLAMARSLNLDVVAEGVEEASQATALRELSRGTSLTVQGYLYSPPLPIEKILDGLPERLAPLPVVSFP